MSHSNYHLDTNHLPASRIPLIATFALWPLAIFTVVHRTFVLPFNGRRVDDFTTVITALHHFRDGMPVYDQMYWATYPHYLYSPGATLFLSPLAWLPNQELSRIAYIGANTIAIAIAIGILVRLFNFRLSGPSWPAVLFALFLTESVTNTLVFSNINGLLLLAQIVFLWALVRRHPWVGGFALGLAILIKPQFAPLIVLPLFKKQWTTAIPALGIPILFNLAAIPLMNNPGGFVNQLMPYLATTRDYANNSITGMGAFFGWPEPMVWFWRVFAAIFVGTTLLLLLQWKESEELFWAASSSSLILIGVFLLSSLGQMYYTIFALPLLFTVTLKRSIMHNPIAWVGIYFCMSADLWFSERLYWPGRLFEQTRGTIGWSLLMVCAATMVTVWTVKERPWESFLDTRRPIKLVPDTQAAASQGGKLNERQRSQPTTP